MRRTILSVAYPLAAGVGAGSIGGAEQVMAMHSAGLVRAGHRSIVIAPAGSSVIGELVPIPKWEGPFDAATIGHAHRAVIERIADVLSREPVDLVHMHGHDFDRYLPTPGVPTLITLHLPPSWYSRDALAPLRRATHFACVSRSQRASLPCWGPNAVVAPNGVDVGSYAPAREKGDYLLVLTRISPEKGIDEALAAATAAGVRLLVAGEVSAWPEHRRYFENHIVPRLGTEHAFLGPIVGERKRSLLARARAVLIPSRAPEASSLVAMEALASGTPVIAYGIGALPDLIDDGKTGFLVDGPASMTRAIAAVGSIDPTACRVEAQARFSASAMTTRYLELYERMLDAERAIATVGATPLAIEEVHGVDALAELAAEWAVLVARSPTATPFQRPEWLLEYARVFASTADVWALVARREGRLVGLAPLMTRGAETTLLGAGVSDYLDVIVDPGAPLVTAEALVDALLARLGSGGRAVLDELRPGSALRACRASRRGARCIEIEAPRAPCPVLPLPRGLDPLRGLRTRLRQAARRAARVGPLRFERASSREALEAWLTALITLHQARWAARGGGVLAPADVQRFLRRAVPALASVGVASIHGLSIGPRRAAAMLVLEDACAAYYYIGGFDPDLASLSPGTLLLTHAIDAAVAAGRLEFDFLRGAEAYKYRFGAVDRTNVRRILSPVRELPAIVAAPSRRSAAYAALFPR